jgi:nitrogen regulatory protein PII
MQGRTTRSCSAAAWVPVSARAEQTFGSTLAQTPALSSGRLAGRDLGTSDASLWFVAEIQSDDSECIMKKIETVICPHHWDATREVLGTLGVAATLREVKTFGRVPPRREVYRGSPYSVDTSTELELTMLVEDELLESTISAVNRATGGAEILVTGVEYLVRSGDAPRGREVAVRPALSSLRAVTSPVLVPAAAGRA